MLLYHYSVEKFEDGDNELICDYKKQLVIYEPFIKALGIGLDYYRLMLLQAEYNQICAEAKDNRMFSFWVKDATEGLFEFIRRSYYLESSTSRATGIYYCKDLDASIACLKEDCIEQAQFKPEVVVLFEVELADDKAYEYDQTYFNDACEYILKHQVTEAIECAKHYFNQDHSSTPIIELISNSRNKITKKIEWNK